MRNEKREPSRAVTEARLKTLERWFRISLDPLGEPLFVSVYDYALDKLPDIRFVERALDALGTELHRCKAQSPAQFRQWCYKQIDKRASKLNPKSAVDKKHRKNVKPFDYERHGDYYFIALQDSQGTCHFWKIPADWLEQARILWPVYVRRFPDGRPYVSRKVSVLHPDGSRSQKDVGVHRLFLGLPAVRRLMEVEGSQRNVVDGSDAVTACNGNFLDWTEGNLQLCTSSDALDHADSMSDMPDDILWDIFKPPAKSTRMPIQD